MSVLDRIAVDKRASIARRQARIDLAEMQQRALDAPLPPDFRTALQSGSLGVIAEFKRRSPSRGWLAEHRDVRELATAYANGGAVGMSVLTEEDHFAGRDEDLQAARSACALPLLRKDFTLDVYQIYEARMLGASAVLLIVRMIDDAFLRLALDVAREAQLAALVEVHDQPELERAVACGSDLIGINNRNLDTFEVSLDTCIELKRQLPDGTVTVAESGIHTRADVTRIEQAGFDAMLIGESLVTSDDPAQHLGRLLGREVST